MPVFVSDTFAGTSGAALTSRAGEIGATWTRYTQVTGVTNAIGPAISNAGRARGQGGTSATCSAYASGVPASAEYDITFDAHRFSDLDTDIVGVLARASLASETLYFGGYYKGASVAGLYMIQKRVAGVITTLGTYTVALGSPVAVKFEVRDAAKKLFVGGVERITTTDNAVTAAGVVGIWLRLSADATGYHLDNLVATDAPTINNYTLTASGGSFSLAGQPASLKASRVLSSGPGSFALAGQAANLKSSRSLSSGVGTFAVSGLPASLAIGRSLAAGPGSFALAGQASGFLVGRRVVASAGSFTLSGKSIQFGYTPTAPQFPVLAAGSGSFALSGQPVALRTTRTIRAEAGSFSLAGIAAGLKRSRNLAASAGTFALTLQPAGLKASRTLAAGAGTFTLSPGSVNWNLVKPGSYVLAGGVGAFTLAGQSALLRVGRRLVAEPGSFAFAGQSIVLVRSGQRRGIPIYRLLLLSGDDEDDDSVILVPTSYIVALVKSWRDAGHQATHGRLAYLDVHPREPWPFHIVQVLEELPDASISADVTPCTLVVETYSPIQAIAASEGVFLRDWISSPDIDPQPIRELVAWTTGRELWPLHEDSDLTRDKILSPNGKPAFRYRSQFRLSINGTLQ